MTAVGQWRGFADVHQHGHRPPGSLPGNALVWLEFLGMATKYDQI